MLYYREYAEDLFTSVYTKVHTTKFKIAKGVIRHMIKLQIFNIVFSIILLPVNFCCAFWLFLEALNLTGMTFTEFINKSSHKTLTLNTGRHRTRQLKKFLTDFFNKNSLNPQKSMKLTWTFGICTIPGILSLNLAFYAAINPDKPTFIFIGNIILLIISAVLAIAGKIYRRNNPLNKMMSDKLNTKRERSRKKLIKNIIVYSITGSLFLGTLLFFMFAAADVFHSQPASQQTATTVHSRLLTVLNEKGYETANISTTYWNIDENKLLHTAAGIKDGCKIEFYGYSDSKTVDLVYNQIVYFTAPELENSERESYETIFSDSGKMFTITVNNISYVILYKNDTLIYAYAPASLNELNEILTEIGYLKNRQQ